MLRVGVGPREQRHMEGGVRTCLWPFDVVLSKEGANPLVREIQRRRNAAHALQCDACCMASQSLAMGYRNTGFVTSLTHETKLLAYITSRASRPISIPTTVRTG